MSIARPTVTRSILAGALALLCATGAQAACPEGTIQVGERRVTQGNVVVVHPICRRVATAPPEPGEPARMSGIEDAVNFRAAAPGGRALTIEQAVRRPLVNGMSFATGAGGRARLTFPDGTMLTLGPNTRFVVENQPGPGNAGPDGARLNLARGFARWVHAQRDEISQRLNRRFGIRVGTVAVAVRGTDFDLSLDANGNGFIRLREGVIDYRTPENGVPRELRAGQTLRIARGRPAGIE